VTPLGPADRTRHIDCLARPIPDDYPPSAHVTGYWFLDQSDDDQVESAYTTGGLPRGGQASGLHRVSSMGFGKGAERAPGRHRGRAAGSWSTRNCRDRVGRRGARRGRDRRRPGLGGRARRIALPTCHGSRTPRRRFDSGRHTGGSDDAGRAVPWGPAILGRAGPCARPRTCPATGHAFSARA
jgi:hypothetical protein